MAELMKLEIKNEILMVLTQKKDPLLIQLW